MKLADDHTLVRHYLALWDSYGTPREHLYADAERRVLAFLEEGRRELKLKGFVAEEGEEAIGSAGCQIHLSPYPQVVMPSIASMAISSMSGSSRSFVVAGWRERWSGSASTI